jgi:hypothetical protein
MGYLDDYSLHAANELEDLIKPLFKPNKQSPKQLDKMEVIHLTPELWQTIQISELAKALAKFSELLDKESLKKDAKSHRNTYISLDNIIHTVRPLLAKCGLSVTQDLAGSFLITTLLHESGQFKGSAMPFYPMEDGNVNTLQAIGGGISYAKRYSISALLCISSDVDNDANGMKNKKVTSPKIAAPKKIDDDKVNLVIDWAKKHNHNIKIIETNYSLTPIQKAKILKAIK